MNINLLLEASLSNILSGFKKDSIEHSKKPELFFKKYKMINVNKLDKRSDNVSLDGYSIKFDDETNELVIIGKVNSTDSRTTEPYYSPLVSFSTSNIKSKSDVNYKNLFTKEESHVTCTCDSFKFQMSKGNRDRDSLYVGKYNNFDTLEYVTTKKTWSPNPQKKGLLCKHLLVLLKDIKDNWDTWKELIISALDKVGFFGGEKTPEEPETTEPSKKEKPKSTVSKTKDTKKPDEPVKVEPEIEEPEIEEPKQNVKTKQTNKYDLDSSTETGGGELKEPTPKKEPGIIKKIYRGVKDKLSKAKANVGKFFSKDKNIDVEEEPAQEEPQDFLEESLNGFDEYFSKYSLLQLNEKSVDDMTEEYINFIKKGL